MKKSLVAMACTATIASAYADVDVSGGIKMYGVLDQAITSQKLVRPDTGAAQEYIGMFAANATSRIGFKGSRDLSEDFKGIFQAEIQLDPDTSTLLPTKNRTAFVGLQSANVGTIAMGTMETAAYEVFGMDVNGRVEYKPQVWRTTTSLDLQDRANNSIKYISPEFGGLVFHYQQSFSEYSDTSSPVGSTDNKYAEIISVALKYHKEKMKAAYVHDETKNALMGFKFAGLSNAGPTTTGTSDGLYYYGGFKDTTTASQANTTAAITNATIQRDIASIGYDFGSFYINYLYAKSALTGTYAGSNTTQTIGIRVPYEKFTFALSYGSGSVNSYYSSSVDPSTTTTAPAGRAKDGSLSDTTVGVYYNFDKSTSVYFLGSSSKSSVGDYDGSNTTVAIGARYNF